MPNENDVSNEVVRYLRHKNVTGEFDPVTYLGIEQRFVNALHKSGVHNFEEQYILGANTITEYYTDANRNKISVKFFCGNEDDLTDCYKLYTKENSEGINVDYYFDEESIKFTNAKEEFAVYGTGVPPLDNENATYFLDDEYCMFDGGVIKFVPVEAPIIKKQILYYVDENNVEDLICTKTFKRKVSDNEIISTEDIVRDIA